MLMVRSEESSQRLVACLLEEQVAIMACDTIYGFVGVVPDTEEKIRQIKGRSETKPFLQLIPEQTALAGLGVSVPDTEIFSLWPGPFTFVLPVNGGTAIAYRVPEDERLRHLLERIASPLYSTSVNRAGFPPMDNPASIHDEFGEEVGIVEDSGIYDGRSPSTVIDLTDRPFRILRQGAGFVPPAMLLG